MNQNKSNATLSYVGQFRVHQKFVQAHLKGTLDDEQPLLPTFFPPSSYWSSDEKNLFFHGLAVYSRFRPDLIAESIKTKTVLDVCLYLDILQTASSSKPSEIHGSLTGSLEPAMEVSSTWIQNEEKFAAALTQFDSCPWIRGSAEGETESSENPNHCVCSPQSLLVDTGFSPVDHSSHTELKNSYLGHLDCTCLMALEQIVREGQLAEVESAAVPSSPAPDQPATQVEGLSDLDSPESPGVASETPKPDSSKSEAEYLLMKRLYMRRKRAQSRGNSIDMKAFRLRPGRQPRPRPKSYRKKRKIALFSSSRKQSLRDPATVVNSEADHVVSDPTPADEMDQEEESQYGPWSKKNLKNFRRMRDGFLEIGVDSQLASNYNLDFFHLSSLARLMRLHSLINDLTYEVCISADTIQLIVAILKEFISEVVRGCLLSKEQEIRLKSTLKVWKYNQSEITVENVKETLKSMGIAHSNLKNYFAEMVTEGSNGISLPDPSIDTEMGTKDDDNNGDSEGDQYEDDEDEASNEDNHCNTSDTTEQQSAKPSQALTELWHSQSLRRCILPKYIRVCENQDDDILPEIDEVELQRELKEEEELDDRDLLASREYEAELWVL